MSTRQKEFHNKEIFNTSGASGCVYTTAGNACAWEPTWLACVAAAVEHA